MLCRRIISTLRVAWSLCFGIMCLLCPVLWARSYTNFDWFGPGITFSPAPGRGAGGRQVFKASSGYVFETAHGRLFLLYVGNMEDHDSLAWSFGTNDLQPFFQDPLVHSAVNFRFRSTDNGSWEGRAPLWYLAVVSGLLATLAWIKRFSLRTMLVGTSIVAVLLAVALRL